MKMASSHCITEKWYRLAAVIFLLFWDIGLLAAELSPLDDYILHHEALNYDTNNLHTHHLRSEHSTNPIITLSFPAFKRTFNLNLKPDNSLFKNNHELDLGGQKKFGIPKLAYTGHVDGSPNSYVTGTIVNGIFRGEIHSPDTPTLYIEPSSRFLGGRLPYHSVIYSAEHLDVDPYRHLRENETHPMSSCAHHHHHGPEFQREEGEPAVSERLHRYRRAVVDGMLDGTAAKPNTCYLELQADPFLWKYMTDPKANGGLELADPFLWKYMTDPQANGGLGLPKEQAKDEIMSLFVSHVSSLNEIFTTTKFNTKDDSMYYRGITFIVQRSHVMTWESENCTTAQAGEFCRDNYDVNALLYQSSLSDHSTFCLSYLFTYRDFQRGTLGLAWVGKPSAGLTGGICEPYRESTEANNKRVRKSLNTGVVSLLNYGKRVAVRISQLTFAHEVGHNFGAEHDTGNECAPYGTNAANAAQGNFIMYSSANPGNLDNNNKFSPCSRDYIAQVLHVVVNNLEGKRNCFNQSGIAYCGNGLVEDGEECDCGFTSDCDDDDCCTPRTEGMNDGCKRRTDTNGNKFQCSPSEGPCCLKTCGFVQESVRMECSPNQECSNASFCNGNSAKCPKPVLVANNEFCDENKHVCETGQCIGSICARINWEECFLDGDWKTQNEDMCYVSCKDPISGDCVSSKNTEIVKKFPDFTKLLEEVGQGTLKPVQLNQGSPCKNFQGYCDSRFKCRQIDSDGAFKRLLNFFDTASLEEVRVWMTTNWWAVMLICIGLVLLMAGFIKLCSYSTPTENPNRKPRRQQKEIREVNPLQDAQPLHENPAPRSNRSNPSASHNDTGLYQAQNYKSDNRGAPSYGSASHTTNYDLDYDQSYDRNYPPPSYTDDMAPPRYDPYRPDFQKGYRRY